MTRNAVLEPAALPADKVFLFSSATSKPDAFFQGYCFVGSDFVFGAARHILYQEAYGRRVGAGEDGCYVAIQRQVDDFVFEADYSGYKKLFYFWSEAFWAVSNSLALLLEHLNDQGVDVKPNYAQLESIKCAGGSVLRYMTSFHSIAEDVFLVPVDCSLRIGAYSVSLLPHNPRSQAESYEVALTNFLELWVSLFETLLACHQISIVSDLTGGVDSRVVFALLQMAQARLAPDSLARVKIHCGSSVDDSRDLEVAALICRELNVPLNAPLMGASKALSSTQAYLSWRYLNLGAYHLIYLRNGYGNPRFIFFSGGGGGNHKLFYGRQFEANFVDNFIRSCSWKILSKPRSRKFEREMRKAMNYIYSAKIDSPEALILHYRHFRNRFHAGRAPQHVTMFCPLASSALDLVARVAGLERLADAQVHHDILGSLNPELLDFPFDKPEKAPSARARDRLISIGISNDAASGRVFCDWYSADLTVVEDSQSALECLAEDFAITKMHSFVREFCGEALIAEAEDGLQRALEREGFRHANDAKSISAVMAAGLFAVS